MSRKAKLKFGIFFAGLVIAAISGALALRALFHLIASFQEGADPESAFHGYTVQIPESEQAKWLSSDPQDGGKVPKAAEQEEILSSYWGAWQSLSAAYRTNETDELLTYWTGAAYHQILDTLIEGTDLTTDHHQLSLLFFSDDSSVIHFEDRDFNLEWQNGDLQLSSRTTAVVTMTLDQGYWRIRLIEFQHRPR